MLILNKFLFACVALLAISGCCDKEYPQPEPMINEPVNGIYGEWMWIKSKGGFSGTMLLTPQNMGYTEKLTFDNYIFKRFYNDSIVYQGQYDLEIDSQNYFGYDELLTLENNLDYGIKLNNDTLFLYDLCFDCFRHEYHRN